MCHKIAHLPYLKREEEEEASALSGVTNIRRRIKAGITLRDLYYEGYRAFFIRTCLASIITMQWFEAPLSRDRHANQSTNDLLGNKLQHETAFFH